MSADAQQMVEWAGVAAEERRRRRDLLVEVGTQEVAEHLHDAASNAKAYIREYAEFLTSPKRQTVPMARGIHPSIAAMIREILRDAEVSRRRGA